MTLVRRLTKVQSVAVLALGLLMVGLPAGAASIDKQPVHLFSDGSVVSGAWTGLTTNNQGATMSWHSSGFPANTARTILWVIFNHPENCAGPSIGHPFQCGASDLGTPAVQASIVVGPTEMTDDTGNLNVGGHLAAGDTTNALFGPGLVNTSGAHIHLVEATFTQFSVHE